MEALPSVKKKMNHYSFFCKKTYTLGRNVGNILLWESRFKALLQHVADLDRNDSLKIYYFSCFVTNLCLVGF